MPVIDTEDDFGRQVIAMDGSHGVAVRLDLSFEAWAPSASWLAAMPAAFCCPSSQIVGRS